MLTFKKQIITTEIEEDILVLATCDACAKLLEIKDNNTPGVLYFNIGGGYGDYIDGSICGIICTECINKLKQLFPKMFEQYSDGVNNREFIYGKSPNSVATE